MNEERLAELEALEQAATEAPWWFDESDLCWRLHGVAWRTKDSEGLPSQIVNKQILKAPKRGTTMAEYWPDKADAAFIVGAREGMKELLAEVRRLQAEAAAQVEREQRILRRARELCPACDEGDGPCTCHDGVLDDD